jgi:hypothetical protein
LCEGTEPNHAYQSQNADTMKHSVAPCKRPGSRSLSIKQRLATKQSRLL